MIRLLLLLLLPVAAQAESIRIASFNTELSRDGPGLLLRDIQRGDAQVQAVVEVLTAVDADILALQGIDWDLDGLAVNALSEAVGNIYPHVFAAMPNSGLDSGLDLDGDGRTQGPGDAQGWGRFTGQGGLAVLSKHEILAEESRSFTSLLWRDLPGAELPQLDGQAFPSQQAQHAQRLSSTAHWVIPIDTPLGQLDLLTFHATPPVFDGPEDRNGLRNRDEIRLWSLLLDGTLDAPPAPLFVIAGDANLDPRLGEGRKKAIRDLLNNSRLQDPQPKDQNGSIATVQWKAVGELRVDYVLPSVDLRVTNAGVFWPNASDPLHNSAQQASRHRLVWVDVTTR
jgi:endonuclease/exonuclease/phosphatase family metal-dependent hydrolase